MPAPRSPWGTADETAQLASEIPDDSDVEALRAIVRGQRVKALELQGQTVKIATGELINTRALCRSIDDNGLSSGRCGAPNPARPGGQPHHSRTRLGARHTASRQNSLEVGFDGDGGEVRGKALCRFEILALDVDLPGPNPLLLSELMQDVLGRIGGLGFSVPSNTALVPLAGYDDGKGCRSHSLNMVGDGCFCAVTERPRSRLPTANGVWLLTPSWRRPDSKGDFSWLSP